MDSDWRDLSQAERGGLHASCLSFICEPIQPVVVLVQVDHSVLM